MAMTVTQASAVNIVLKELLGYDEPLGFRREITEEDLLGACVLLATHAYKTLMCGLRPDQVEEIFKERVNK